MIEDAIIFAVALAVFAVVACAYGDFVRTRRKTVTCRCGLKSTRNVLVARPADEAPIIETLNELCPICRCNARNRFDVSTLSPVAVSPEAQA